MVGCLDDRHYSSSLFQFLWDKESKKEVTSKWTSYKRNNHKQLLGPNQLSSWSFTKAFPYKKKTRVCIVQLNGCMKASIAFNGTICYDCNSYLKSSACTIRGIIQKKNIGHWVSKTSPHMFSCLTFSALKLVQGFSIPILVIWFSKITCVLCIHTLVTSFSSGVLGKRIREILFDITLF